MQFLRKQLSSLPIAFASHPFTSSRALRSLSINNSNSNSNNNSRFQMAAVCTVQAIGTHNGAFHADEALACFMLHQTAVYKDWPIVRSRDAAVHATLPILVDVGAVYDPAAHRYDHHQRGFTETFDSEHSIKLSSAGLVYLHFGREVIANVIAASARPAAAAAVAADPLLLELMYQRLYNSFIEAMDGIDNGVEQYTAASGLQQHYKSSTDLSSRVGNLNPQWNAEAAELTEEARLKQFHKAIAITGADFTDALLYFANSWLPARAVVAAAFAARHSVHASGELLLLLDYSVWKSHVFDLEREQNVVGNIKFVLYPDAAPAVGFRVQSMPSDNDGFGNRQSLHHEWCGVRDQQLSLLSGIEGCVFVHAAGFIGGNKTQEGAIQMAVKTLELAAEAKAAAATAAASEEEAASKKMRTD